MTRSMAQVLLLTVLGALLLKDTQGANILTIFTCPSPSHLIIEISMAKVLAENGHNVTVITTLKPHVSHKNINLIYVPLTDAEEDLRAKTIAEISMADNSNMMVSFMKMIGQIQFMFDKNRDVMRDPRVTDLYENTDNKFDLVMLGYFLNNFQLGIAQKLKVPVIIASSMFQWAVFNPILGNPNEVSYVPSMDVAVEKGRPMTFRQRLANLFSINWIRIFTYLVENKNAKLYKELYGDDPNMPEYEELNKNVSLILFNSFSLSEGPIRPNVPGVVEVGGIQVKETPDALPKAMAEFLNNSTDGAILLSLGSNMQGSYIKPKTVKNMFNVLSKLKQRVIWKWEDLDKTPGKSDNILYSKWLPQDDILAHPKIILFINHAGRGGITESQYHGKPMLSLPVFGDQPGNADKMVKDGFGLSMSLLTLEEQPFRENILEILKNPQYTQKVKQFSILFRDRPLTARQSVLYWTEYVLRHHGAPHLQSPKVHMSFLAANNLDVYAMLLSMLGVFLFISKFVIIFICRKLCSSAKKAKSNINAKKMKVK